MQFAHGQLSERYHSRCLSSLHKLSALARLSRSPSLVRILQRCLQSLVNSTPRAVAASRLVWHLFTDGALEASKSSIGGVLVDFFSIPAFTFHSSPRLFQSYNIWISLHFAPRDPSHFGGTSPLARPALRHGHFLLCGQRSCTSFSHSHVSDNHAADQLVQHFLRLEQRMIPTEVNVADAPSRGNKTKHLEQPMERAAAVEFTRSCTVSFLEHECT